MTRNFFFWLYKFFCKNIRNKTGKPKSDNRCKNRNKYICAGRMVDMYIKTDIERQNRNRAIDPFFEICRRILFERLKFYIYKKFGWLYEKTLKRKKILGNWYFPKNMRILKNIFYLHCYIFYYNTNAYIIKFSLCHIKQTQIILLNIEEI